VKIELQRVQFMPKVLSPGILYVAEEFGAAAHLCACGCGAKVRTPLGPVDWLLEETIEGPSLYPSVGNWQQACKSHYWIFEGKVIWEDEWSPKQIAAGRRHEQRRARAYYDGLDRKRVGLRAWLWQRVKDSFKRER
jgi:hypothetical protein